MIPEPGARENIAYGRLWFYMIGRSYTTRGNCILTRTGIPITSAEAGVQFHYLGSGLSQNNEVVHSGSKPHRIR